MENQEKNYALFLTEEELGIVAALRTPEKHDAIMRIMELAREGSQS